MRHFGLQCLGSLRMLLRTRRSLFPWSVFFNGTKDWRERDIECWGGAGNATRKFLSCCLSTCAMASFSGFLHSPTVELWLPARFRVSFWIYCFVRPQGRWGCRKGGSATRYASYKGSLAYSAHNVVGATRPPLPAPPFLLGRPAVCSGLLAITSVPVQTASKGLLLPSFLAAAAETRPLRSPGRSP